MNITKKNQIRENQIDRAFSAKDQDHIPMSMQDMNNIKRWQWMLLVITAIVERERSFIPDKIQNLKDQQVSKVN